MEVRLKAKTKAARKSNRIVKLLKSQKSSEFQRTPREHTENALEIELKNRTTEIDNKVWKAIDFRQMNHNDRIV